MKEKHQAGLMFLAWIAPIAALPYFFFAVVGWGMSTSSPHATPGELFKLSIGPLVGILALFPLVASNRITFKRNVALLPPALLTLAEILFVFVLWQAG